MKRSYRRDRITGIEIDNDERAFRFRTGIDYVMGLNGELKGPDGPVDQKPAKDEYRFDGSEKANDSLELEKSIEQKKKNCRTWKKRKQAKSQINYRYKNKRKSNEDGSYASGPNPASSLVEWF